MLRFKGGDGRLFDQDNFKCLQGCLASWIHRMIKLSVVYDFVIVLWINRNAVLAAFGEAFVFTSCCSHISRNHRDNRDHRDPVWPPQQHHELQHTDEQTMGYFYLCLASNLPPAKHTSDWVEWREQKESLCNVKQLWVVVTRRIIALMGKSRLLKSGNVGGEVWRSWTPTAHPSVLC